VIGSNPIFSTHKASEYSGAFFVESGTKSGTKARIQNLQNSFSTPFIHTGKVPTRIPRGSTKLAELAKNRWYVEFYFHDSASGVSNRFRLSQNLNRLKDYQQKVDAFSKLLDRCINDLNEGWNPNEEQEPRGETPEVSYDKLHLSEAILKFLEYHESKGNRPKTIGSYRSKLKLFINHLGDMEVREITDFHITDFLNTCEKTRQWTGVTYNFARITLNNFFVFLKRYKHTETNPATGLESRKEIKTELHQVFSDEDFTKIMTWLKQNDPYTLLFVKTIYYTCIRPKELRQTKLKHINMEYDRIVIPATISKNKKAIPVQIDATLKKELLGIGVKDYPSEFYLFGDINNIIGPTMISENKPYNRFQACLKALSLTEKNYTLYSFKHLSNVRKYLAGWTIAEICAANRHSSLVETETYLKDLIKFIPVTKSVPII
jgi:integrase